MRIIVVFILICLNAAKLVAQRPNSDFIAPCGPAAAGLYLPIDKNSTQKLFSDSRVNGTEYKNLCFEIDSFCNGGKPVELIQWLKENPLTKLEIKIHSDSRGENTLNIKISQSRAKSLRDALISTGIEPSRIVATGMGENDPLIPDERINKMKTVQEKEAAHQVNRRVEIKIIAVNYKYWFGIGDQYFFVDQVFDPSLTEQFNRQHDQLFRPESKEQQLNSTTGADSARRVLNVLAIFLQTHPGIKVELGMFTDGRGNSAQNLATTQSRANALVHYLAERGVRREQLVAKGYGSANLVMTEAAILKLPVAEQEKNRAKNHRMIVKIIAVN